MSGFFQTLLVPFSCWRICVRARRVIHVLSLACVMLAAASCSWVNLHPDTYKDSETQFLNAERPRYKHPSGQPQFCVAFSGGGIRSAAYSIGVLKGLHASGKLRGVDIISAVSGGSYATTWLYDQYAQQASSGASGPDKLDRLDKILSRDSIETVARTVTHLNLRQAAQSFGHVQEGHDGSPLLKFLNGEWLSGGIEYLGRKWMSYVPPWRDKHLTPSGLDYEANITNAFQFSTNKPSMRQASSDLPYLIVNATIQDVPGRDNPLRRLANDIFEFTSHGVGSPSVGYKSWAELKPEDRADRYTFARSASISGAAVDKSTVPVLHVYGSDAGLGYAMLTPSYPDGWIRRYIKLTDGGDSENLGVYGLIKRNCNEILVVDAEYDGEITLLDQPMYGRPLKGYEHGYQFKSYQCLKQKLKKEGVELMIDEVDRATNGWNCEAKDQEFKPETEIPSDTLRCWNRAVNTKRKWFDCSKPTSTGSVSGQKHLRVTYAKLSADRKLLDDCSEGKKAEAQKVYGPLITTFYNKENESDKQCKNSNTDEESKKAKTDEKFPHYSTFQFAWPNDQFLAIAELGCRAVRRHYDPQFRQSADVCIGEKK